MIGELHTASELLRSALDRYLDACATFASHYDPGSALNRSSRSLSSSIAKELKLVKSYKSKMDRAKSIVAQIRNSTPALAPISVLPSAVLVHVFHLILCTQPCALERPGYPNIIWKYPELILRVCSRWRQIALSSRSLWSHIDLAQSPRWGKLLLSSAKLFAGRAGESPLHVHVLHDASIRERHHGTDLIKFCAFVAPRMRSLQLSMHFDFTDLSHPILQSCFANCIPGTLTQLSLSGIGSGNERYRFFEGPGNPETPQRRLFDRDVPQLEAVLLQVTALRLLDVYPYWTSKAYHGLVELRLLTGSSGITIAEPYLVNMLASSPSLRVFHFNLAITDQILDNALLKPIRLESLEVLNLKTEHCGQVENLVRWVAPGLKPLHVSLKFHAGGSTYLLGDVFTKFYARSNITQLNLVGIGCSLPLHSLILLLPKLRTLSLRSFHLVESNPWSIDPPGLACRPPQLDAIHIRCCSIWVNEFRWIAKIHSIHTITVYNAEWVYFRSEKGTYGMRGGRDMLENYLSGIAPVIKILDKDEVTSEVENFHPF